MVEEPKENRRKKEPGLLQREQRRNVTTIQFIGVLIIALAIASLGIYLAFLYAFSDGPLWYLLLSVVLFYSSAMLLDYFKISGESDASLDNNEDEYVFKGPIRNVSEKREKALAEEAIPKCPKCNSPHIVANKKGYGFIKGAAGLFTVGPLGLMGGFVGSRKLQLACLSCGNRWNLKKKNI